MMNVEKQVKLFIYIIYLILLLFGGTVGAIMLWKSFGNTRESRLKMYTDDIEIWNSTKRAEFVNSQFRVQLLYENDTASDPTEALNGESKESFEHHITEDNYDDIFEKYKYEPYFYKLKDNASTFGINAIEEFNADENLTFAILASFNEEDDQTVKLPALPLYKIKTYYMANSAGGDRLKGHFESSLKKGYVYYVIKHIGVQVDRDVGGNWYLNRNENTQEFGCFTSKQNATDYDLIALEPGQEIDDVLPYTLSKVTFEIRSKYDPWLTVVVVTEDSGSFGMTSMELKYLGIGLLFGGGGLTVQPICWILVKCRMSRELADEGKRQGVYRYNDFEYDEYEAGPADNGPIRASSVNQIRDIDIEMEDLDTARDNGLPVKNPYHKRLKKVIKKGEYESYYHDR